MTQSGPPVRPLTWFPARSMKFTQLPIGARFEFEGKVYVKTGPIAAASESGSQRMIPRYAVLRPLDGSVVARPKPPRSLDETAVLAAFAGFYGVCERLLAAGAAAGEGTSENPRQALAAARQQFLAALGSADPGTDAMTKEGET